MIITINVQGVAAISQATGNPPTVGEVQVARQAFEDLMEKVVLNKNENLQEIPTNS